MFLRPSGFALGILLLSFHATAGVFSIPHFVEPGEFSLGIEPEIILSQDSGLGMNGKYTQGISDLFELMGMVGGGSGAKNFRAGVAGIFDFFPDSEGQPGLGLAAQGVYARRRDVGRFDFTFTPYIHKLFSLENGNAIAPFAALPLGWGFKSDGVDWLTQFAVGTEFQFSQHFSAVVELGIDVSRTETYFSGGLVYFH